MPTPITTAPCIWLRPASVLMIFPASMTVTTRLTRSRAISGCQVTSAKWQPNDCVENFGFGLPNVAGDWPLPETIRRLAWRRISANGVPFEGPSALIKIRPFSTARSSGLWLAKGDPGVDTATIFSEPIAWSAAKSTAFTTDAVAMDPPESGPAGSEVSPSSTSTLSSGTPVLAEANCARTVYVPVPISCVALATRQVPSSLSCTFAAASKRAATHEHPAIPQPNVRPSRFIDPTAGLRLDQPNLSAPSWKHSSKFLNEKKSP